MPPRGASSPLAKGQDLPAKQVCSPLGTSLWGQVTLTYGCWVVTCLVLSPLAGRVVGCSEDNVVAVGMVVVGMVGLGLTVVGEKGWMQGDAGVEAGKSGTVPPTPSSCSADGHSPGKQASEHSLLSSAFTCAMPKSLLLSHLRPRKAPVLGPGRELRQLTPRLGAGACRCLLVVGCGVSVSFPIPSPTSLKKKKKR